MVVQKIKNGNNFYYFHFINSHTVVKNHSNLMASVRVFRDEPSFFTSDDANIQNSTSVVNILSFFHLIVPQPFSLVFHNAHKKRSEISSAPFLSPHS